LYHNLLVQDAILNMQTGKPADGKIKIGDAMFEIMNRAIAELQRAFTHMKLNYRGVADLGRFVGKYCALYISVTFCSHISSV
jgi:hypothetical protein